MTWYNKTRVITIKIYSDEKILPCQIGMPVLINKMSQRDFGANAEPVHEHRLAGATKSMT